MVAWSCLGDDQGRFPRSSLILKQKMQVCKWEQEERPGGIVGLSTKNLDLGGEGLGLILVRH